MIKRVYHLQTPLPPGRAAGESLDQIRELEELAANAWPAGVQQALDGWRLRYHLGVTRRANSAPMRCQNGASLWSASPDSGAMPRLNHSKP